MVGARKYCLGAMLISVVCTGIFVSNRLPGATHFRVVPKGLDLYLPVPEDNPLTPERVALGRKLFFDPALSRDRTVACATCHDPAKGFSNGKAVGTGVRGQKGTRNVPTLINRAYGSSYFWDGRAATLEEQVLKPIQAQGEMDMTLAEVEARLRKASEYRRAFDAVFPDGVTASNVARSIASYVRTVLSGDSAVDRYQFGDTAALPDVAKHGMELFYGKANCGQCHAGPNFSDEEFHNTGVGWGTEPRDLGRYEVTKKVEDRGKFKTPTLREITRTAPYMHDGSLAILEEVIEFYSRGGNPNPHLDPDLRPLQLTAAEKEALLGFLRALSGDIWKRGTEGWLKFNQRKSS